MHRIRTHSQVAFHNLLSLCLSKNWSHTHTMMKCISTCILLISFFRVQKQLSCMPISP